MVEKSAHSRGHTITAKIDPALQLSAITKDSMASADICIDFSNPNAVLDNIRKTAQQGKNIVVGTTGWYDHVNEVEKIVEDNKIGLLYSPNFSLGINIFLQIISTAAALFNRFPDYDVGMTEAHHRQKEDSPSGTAHAIAREIMRNIHRKHRIVDHIENKAIPTDAIHVSSLRVGTNPGTHSVIFDSHEDSITLTHQAHNRNGFALGAVLAAEWLADKKGMHTMDDFLKGVFHG